MFLEDTLTKKAYRSRTEDILNIVSYIDLLMAVSSSADLDFLYLVAKPSSTFRGLSSRPDQILFPPSLYPAPAASICC